jgi:hypothetical protein
MGPNCRARVARLLRPAGGTADAARQSLDRRHSDPHQPNGQTPVRRVAVPVRTWAFEVRDVPGDSASLWAADASP